MSRLHRLQQHRLALRLHRLRTNGIMLHRPCAKRSAHIRMCTLCLLGLARRIGRDVLLSQTRWSWQIGDGAVFSTSFCIHIVRNSAFYSDAAAGQLVDEMESLVGAAVDLLATQVSSETNRCVFVAPFLRPRPTYETDMRSKPALKPPETLERWERANVRLLEMLEARRTRGVRLGPNLHTFEYHWRRYVVHFNAHV